MLTKSVEKGSREARASNMMSYTVHVYFPNLVVTNAGAKFIREACIHNLSRILGVRNGEVQNVWGNVFDPSIYMDNGFRMYGSDKFENRCKVCESLSAEAKRECWRCNGRGRHSAGRLYTPFAVLEPVTNSVAEEALLLRWQRHVVELWGANEDATPRFDVAILEAERIAQTRPDLLRCALCHERQGGDGGGGVGVGGGGAGVESEAVDPDEDVDPRTLGELMLQMSQRMYGWFNFAELHRLNTNVYYAVLRLTTNVESCCPATPGMRTDAVMVGDGAATRLLEREQKDRETREFDLMQRGARITDKHRAELAANRDRANALLKEHEKLCAEQGHSLVRSIVSNTTEEQFSTRAFAFLQLILNAYLPSPYRERYGGHVLRSLHRIETVRIDKMIGQGTELHGMLMRAHPGGMLHNVYILTLQGKFSKYCHNIGKSHSNENICLLMADRLVTQVCFSTKVRVGGACCTMQEGGGRCFNFAWAPARMEEPADLLTFLFPVQLEAPESRIRLLNSARVMQMSGPSLPSSFASSASASVPTSVIQEARARTREVMVASGGATAASMAKELRGVDASVQNARSVLANLMSRNGMRR